MSLTRLVVLIALLAAGIHWWNQHTEAAAIARLTDAHGFIPVPMPAGAKPNVVLIFAPQNCPKEGAQRAAAISAGLKELSIPNVMTSRYAAQSFEQTQENLAAFKRLDVVMRGEIPIVLVNGMGKANATLEEIVAEYEKVSEASFNDGRAGLQ